MSQGSFTEASGADIAQSDFSKEILKDLKVISNLESKQRFEKLNVDKKSFGFFERSLSAVPVYVPFTSAIKNVKSIKKELIYVSGILSICLRIATK